MDTAIYIIVKATRGSSITIQLLNIADGNSWSFENVLSQLCLCISYGKC